MNVLYFFPSCVWVEQVKFDQKELIKSVKDFSKNNKSIDVSNVGGYQYDNFKDWLINEDLPQHVEQAGIRILNNIVNFMMKEDKSHKWDWFCEYTRQLDKLRSQSIVDIVPHYERYFKE